MTAVTSSRPWRPTRQGPGPGDRDLVPLSGRGVLHFSDDRTITFVPRTEGVYALLGGLLSRSKVGGLTPGLTLAGANNHLVASFDVTKFPASGRSDPAEINRCGRCSTRSRHADRNLADETANLELA